MADQEKTGIVQSFERVTGDDGQLVDIIVDTGGGRLLTLEHVTDCGDDSPPLAGDSVAISESTGQGAARSAGYVDLKNAGKAIGGEKRIYARDPDDGSVVAEVWLKGTGDIVLTSIKSGSKIILNGVEIDQQGNVTTPGEVTAMLGTAPVKLSTHLHPTGVGPSGAPTPGT
jgi:hypothetical protein